MTDRPSYRPDHNAADLHTPYSLDSFYKKQLDAANKEKAQLQDRLRQADVHKNALLKSLLQLSCSSSSSSSVPPLQSNLPVDIVAALKNVSAAESAPAATSIFPPVSGKGSAYRRSGTSDSHHTLPPVDLAVFATAPPPSAMSVPATSSTSATSPGQLASSAPSPFRKRADLKGHSSAVYSVQFSPNGQLLASASFDRTIRLWPITCFIDRSGAANPRLLLADAHRAPIVAVEWSFDSARVISGALDQTAAEWDVASGSKEPVTRFACAGLVNAVSVSPVNEDLFFVATSRRVVHLFDRRVARGAAVGIATATTGASGGGGAGGTAVVENDAAVNTVHVSLDGVRFMTGDQSGAIKTWDVRKPRVRTAGCISHSAAPPPPSVLPTSSSWSASAPAAAVSSSLASSTASCAADVVDVRFNDDNRRPITHIHASPPLGDDEHGHFVAVNSYDAYLRIYERGALVLPGEKPELKAVHALRGVCNAHWPIKSSFFVGADYRPPSRRGAGRGRCGRSAAGGDGGTDTEGRAKGGRRSRVDSEREADLAEEVTVYSSESEDEESSGDEWNEGEGGGDAWGGEWEEQGRIGAGACIQSGVMLACGSADGLVYVFDVGGRAGRWSLLQTLDGHTDRVYCVDFHPERAILASCGADGDVKIWHAR